MRYLLFDIDGVLADCTHRLHYKEEKNYDAFYDGNNIANDETIEGGWELLRLLSMLKDEYTTGVVVILMTGRPERTRKITDMWFDHYNTQGFFSPDVSRMYMRLDDDHRKSEIVKRMMVDAFFEDFTPDPLDTIIFVDDDPSNCQAIADAYPQVITLTYGVERLNGTGDRK